MARRNSSMEKQIADMIVDGMFKKNKRGKGNHFLSLITIILVAFGMYWVSGSSKDNPNSPQDTTIEVNPSYDSDKVESYNVKADAVDFAEKVDAPSYEYENESVEYVGNGKYRIPHIQRVTVERCVDGDTLIVILPDGVKERVRFIGANTPETVKKNTPIEPFGLEASDYTKRRISQVDNVVTLVADGTTYDRYNRRLAFVYLDDDKVSLNEELCRQGLAKAETQYSFSREMKERLKAAAAQAKREGLGIYSLSP